MLFLVDDDDWGSAVAGQTVRSEGVGYRISLCKMGMVPSFFSANRLAGPSVRACASALLILPVLYV